MKKIYKNKENRILAGIFGGLGEYYNVDPNLLRVIALLFCALTGFFPLIIAYIISSFFIPERENSSPFYKRWSFWSVFFLAFLVFFVFIISIIPFIKKYDSNKTDIQVPSLREHS